MRVTECEYLASIDKTMLRLSSDLPSGKWTTATIDGQPFRPYLPMYAGDISRIEDNIIYIDGEHELTGKTVEFV